MIHAGHSVRILIDCEPINSDLAQHLILINHVKVKIMNLLQWIDEPTFSLS